MNCKNCDKHIEGNFCGNCGQNTKIGKIDYKHVVNEIPDSLFQLNHGLLFTIKELFLRPGIRIREYLDGKRKNYFKPISYVLLLSTIYGLSSGLVDQKTLLGKFIQGISVAYAEDFKSNFVLEILDWIVSNHAYTTLILLPFFAMASYLVFIDFKLNYFEHIVINAYIAGQQAIIYFIFVVLQIITKIDNYFLSLTPLVLSFFFAFWVFYQFFGKNQVV